MDFEGQRLAEQMLLGILLIFATISFVVGYALSNFQLMVQINGAGLILALILVLPDWFFYNYHPWQWLPPLNPGSESAKGK
ncbi:hypothetical protein VOLCADRAFT_84236 [Volvox carteri f. nagariensis]|uniref:Signal peptidase complex subunit 1 n=1 Tax=Volvox carteri f. nagariensis TaxID=3068 RepID=D8UGV6_VOLCA|nr:uncharacterized protein VOLCADRAFT_84236 [Volvox carteri f. nagariensis]EFJ41047.1 hypothetical protein VOLCADRAFT_84236 [Volvox carteri f. nagariensis]|eukprot:XP_002957911.1 hypothetical protein VOLCADRAFT_84236 [Volvox carteri f. nagariensis]